MALIELAPEVLDDFDRFFEHMMSVGTAEPRTRIQEIIDAIQILAHSPLIGRPAKGGDRELVIGRGTRGFVALYRYVPRIDTVFVLAVRHQRERGFGREA